MSSFSPLTTIAQDRSQREAKMLRANRNYPLPSRAHNTWEQDIAVDTVLMLKKGSRDSVYIACIPIEQIHRIYRK